MKKLFFFTCLILILACSENKQAQNPTELLTSNALEQLDSTVKRVVADPNVIIENKKIMFESDSATIIHCDIRGTNAFGGWVKQQTEYIYGICKNGKIKEWMADIKDNDIVFYSKDDLYKQLSGNVNPDFANETDSIKYIKHKAIYNLEHYGKDINE